VSRNEGDIDGTVEHQAGEREEVHAMAEEVRGRFGVAVFLDMDVEDLPVLAHRAPEVDLPHLEPALEEQLLNVTEAEGEALVEPYRVRDDHGREAMSPMRGALGTGNPPLLSGYREVPAPQELSST
jgi:hypothetical protein